MRWMVGSGEIIDILGQPWLLNNKNPYISSIIHGLVDNKVPSIMTLNHRAWDKDISQTCLIAMISSVQKVQSLVKNGVKIGFTRVKSHQDSIRLELHLDCFNLKMNGGVRKTTTAFGEKCEKSEPLLRCSIIYGEHYQIFYQQWCCFNIRILRLIACQVCRMGNETIDKHFD